MSGQHTPGPWFAHQSTIRDNYRASRPIFDDGLWHIRPEAAPETCPIAEIDRGDDHDGPTRANAAANARLIAAAPELLSVLIECRNLMWSDNPADGWKDAIDDATAAILKATGAQS